MPALLPGQIALEKTPGYFHTPGVAKKLWETNNQTKLVLIIRNPVDRMISDYNQFRYDNIPTFFNANSCTKITTS